MAPGRKTGGRKKGTPNKANAEIRERVNAFDPLGKLATLYESLQGDSGAVAPADMMLAKDICATVLPYGYARLSSQQIDMNMPQLPVVHKALRARDKK